MIGQELLSLMYGNPADQIAQAINPNPNPNPGQPQPVGGQGGPPGGSATAAGGGPSGSPSSGPLPPQPPMAPANATQSPPDLAALYMKLHEQDRAANEIDKGTALMASAFGTAQQQHDMMNYAMSQTPDDRVGVASKALLAQKELTDQQEHARFMAGSAGMAKLLGVDQPTAAWMMNDPTTRDDALKTHFENMTKTELGKNLDDAVAAQKAANPNMTDQDLAAYRSKILSYSIDPAAREAATETAKLVAESKNPAALDTAQRQIDATQQSISWLQAHPDAAAVAVKAPEWELGKGDTFAAWLSRSGLAPGFQANQDAMTARAKLDQLQNQLGTESLKASGMSRMAQQEFFKVAASLSDLNSKALSPADVQAELDRLNNRMLELRANVKAQGGQALDGSLSGFADPKYFDKTSPWYTGATVTGDKSPAPGSKGSFATSGTGGGDGGGKHYVWTADGGLQEK